MAPRAVFCRGKMWSRINIYHRLWANNMGISHHVLSVLLLTSCFHALQSNYRLSQRTKLCGRPPQYAPAPSKLTFDLESGVRVTRVDVGYTSMPMPLCSRLRPDVRDRQTSGRQTSDAHHRMPSTLGAGHKGQGINYLWLCARIIFN